MGEKSISLKTLNELFKNKNNYQLKKTEKGHQGVPEGHDGNQGEYNETFKYYQHPELGEGIFMRETYRTNSYGDDPCLYSVEFVEGKARTITVFEPI